MGCDIHAAIEVSDGNGWTPIMFPNKWYRESDPDEPKETPRLDADRNYNAFAILADVRNGSGFAGCDTGDGYVPIAMPRGLPDDISPEAQERACTGDHTPHYITFDEMLAYDWAQETKRRGWVSAVVFEAWDRMKRWESRPSEWCGGISGPRVEHITEQEMRSRVVKIIGEKRGAEYTAALAVFKTRYADTYCSIEWTEPYTRAAGQLWQEWFPLMLKLSRQHKSVRLVMNFDS